MKIEEDGFITIAIGEVEMEHDLYETYNRLIELQNQHGGDGLARNRATVEYLVSLGYPDQISHRTAVRFTNAVFDAVEALEKKGESADTAPPTAS